MSVQAAVQQLAVASVLTINTRRLLRRVFMKGKCKVGSTYTR